MIHGHRTSRSNGRSERGVPEGRLPCVPYVAVCTRPMANVHFGPVGEACLGVCCQDPYGYRYAMQSQGTETLGPVRTRTHHAYGFFETWIPSDEHLFQ